MTLDEAIKHCEEKAREIRKVNDEMPSDCKLSKGLMECACEHEHLAEWLKELQSFRLRFGENKCVECKFSDRKANEYPCSECAYSHEVLFEDKVDINAGG